MAIDLSPGYKPSADEEFMNPKQVGSVDAWKSRAQICGESLLRVSHRKPMTAAAGRGTRPTMSVRTGARIMVQNRERSRCCCGRRNGRLRSLTMAHSGIAKIRANRSI